MVCGDKLAGLHAAQQLIRVSPDAALDHFIGNDPALRVYDKGAAFRHAFCFDIDIKVTGQGMGGVGQHGIPDLPDALGRVVPGLVHKVRVAGYGVDLTADLFELLVFIRQILKFRGADEGEIRRVEEEYALLAQYIRLADLPEFAV